MYFVVDRFSALQYEELGLEYSKMTQNNENPVCLATSETRSKV
jgi:hypothetical protein